eukprot:15053448-Alexandrium_andersonii.AAC.1
MLANHAWATVTTLQYAILRPRSAPEHSFELHPSRPRLVGSTCFCCEPNPMAARRTADELVGGAFRG